jgi:hypothetical protein
MVLVQDFGMDRSTSDGFLARDFRCRYLILNEKPNIREKARTFKRMIKNTQDLMDKLLVLNFNLRIKA